MRERLDLEVCRECLITVLNGTGEEWRVALLLRRFRGGLTIFETRPLTTYRTCGGCGGDIGGTGYAAAAVFDD